MYEIEQRLKYEIMLEYGLTGKDWKDAEKVRLFVLSFDPEDIRAIAEAVEERSVNELVYFLLRQEQIMSEWSSDI